MDAVAPGLGADVNHRIADPGGGRIENLVLIGDPHRHGVDQDIAVVAFIKSGFAADRRHPDAVAVAADAGDHA